MASALRTLDPELLALAKTECNEEQSQREAIVATLQVWITKSPHLKAPTDEQLILAFLRRCRYSQEETKRRFDNYYSLRSVFPEVLGSRQVDEALLTQLQRGVHVIPARPVSPQGPRVIISPFRQIDPKKSNPREAFKLVFILLELLALECDNASISGLIWVVDARDVTMEQMMQYDPFLLKKAFALVDQCLPLRFVEIHMINMRREGQTIFNFVTKFLPSKLPFKFVVHKKSEDLYEHIPREAMTIEYGGTNGYQAEALDYWRQRLLDNKDYLARDAQYGTNEKLRVGLASAWSNGELNGMSGSFRKLELD
ncbi:alpha-tocopherol transfer protein-like [Drosophila pseudoobscura]|uniref:Alpha-tocopherol transfer protein-like n=1 Tax=Drosophila pseudoobscura pseudoobscura TaxID=46245 RepID=A0A6I8UMF2_DROPS|nr:alpha-tocopherol transfer protein-like [Drosophila pseudoobscura]